jgi:dolichyl-phosphate beta-glucosyltransferase
VIASDRFRIVVPCYNEAARLDRDAFAAALDVMPWLDLCFVNDGSTDGTAAVLAELAAKHPTRVEVLSLQRNSGKAEAVRQGLNFVSTHAEYCGFWDADLAASLDELPALRRVLHGETAVQWVFGIRLRSLGRDITRGALRHYLGRVFATLASVALGLGTYDTQCGAKLFRVTPLLQTALSEPFVSRWIFDIELLSRADALLQHAHGQRVDEIVFEAPLRAWHHKAGSKVRAVDFLTALRDLRRVRANAPRWHRAMLVSGTAASS